MIIRCACGAGFLLLLCLQPALASRTQDCPGIVSNIERLACFDRAAGTPAHATKKPWSAPELEAPSVMRVMANEAARTADDLTFRGGDLSESSGGAPELVITAPAIASGNEHAYLAISCIHNISRLQLIAKKPIETGWVTVRLKGDGWSTNETPWQVMENGQVLDAGRGLPAIEQIKKLIGAHRIQVVSDHPEVDGLMFDAQGVGPLISQARRTCRW
jgi:type VI secretion system protein VasI